jgi:hypothetical protein
MGEYLVINEGQIAMNAQQELQTLSYIAGSMQLPKIEYTVKRHVKRGWIFDKVSYSIETQYCKIEGIDTFQEAMNMLMSGGIRMLDINVDRSCYAF